MGLGWIQKLANLARDQHAGSLTDLDLEDFPRFHSAIARSMLHHLRLIAGASLSSATAQTGGMLRSAAISGDLVGASALWMGRTVVLPGTSSGAPEEPVPCRETGAIATSGAAGSASRAAR